MKTFINDITVNTKFIDGNNIYIKDEFFSVMSKSEKNMLGEFNVLIKEFGDLTKHGVVIVDLSKKGHFGGYALGINDYDYGIIHNGKLVGRGSCLKRIIKRSLKLIGEV